MLTLGSGDFGGRRDEVVTVVETPTWPVHDEAEERALVEVLRSGRWGSTSGDTVATFEREFAASQGAAYGICVCNGTLAIAAALRAVGVGVGDEVVVPSYTFIATASAALFVGALPVFADVDPRTHLLDPAAVENVITERTRAVIPVHLSGHPVDMDAFEALGREHGIAVVEDAAQAHGAAYRGRPVGAIGTVGTFSFQSSKNINAGEGGAVLTNDEELARTLYGLVNVGRVPGGDWYQHATVGYNLRMTEFQAAILRVQLGRHAELQRTRERNARLLTELLAEDDAFLLPPRDPAATAHGRHLFLLRVPSVSVDDRKDQVLRALAAAGVTGVSPGYRPLHRNDALLRESAELAGRLGRDYRPNPCPGADQVAADTIWLAQPNLLGDEQATKALADRLRAAVASVR